MLNSPSILHFCPSLTLRNPYELLEIVRLPPFQIASPNLFSPQHRQKASCLSSPRINGRLYVLGTGISTFHTRSHRIFPLYPGRIVATSTIFPQSVSVFFSPLLSLCLAFPALVRYSLCSPLSASMMLSYPRFSTSWRCCRVRFGVFSAVQLVCCSDPH